MSTQPENGMENVGRYPSISGMDLRDYFAAAALTGLLANPSTIGPKRDLAAKACDLAEAVMEELSKREDNQNEK